MSLIVVRKPPIIHIGDASKHGMGAFTSHGRAWYYLIPNELWGRAHINLLEFLTQVISIWVDILEGTSNPLNCILCMGDSMTAMGWMRRSNFKESDNANGDPESSEEWLVKQQIARKIAQLTLDSTQYFINNGSKDQKMLLLTAFRNIYITYLPKLPKLFSLLSLLLSFWPIFTSKLFQQKSAVSLH